MLENVFALSVFTKKTTTTLFHPAVTTCESLFKLNKIPVPNCVPWQFATNS